MPFLLRMLPGGKLLLRFLAGDAVRLLDRSRELLALARARVELIAGELAPVPQGVALEMLPLAFNTIPFHLIPLRLAAKRLPRLFLARPMIAHKGGQTPIFDFSWLGSDPDFSRTQQAAGEKRLEVAPAVGDQIDVDPLSFDAAENAIRLEEGLAVRANPERKQLPWMRAPVRKPCERRDGSQDLILHVRGPVRRIVEGDPIVDLLEVGERVRRQPDREAHQRPARRARSLRVASASAIALPSSICRLPRSRIFSNASVSCVASYLATSCITAVASPFWVITSGSRLSASSRIISAALALT